MTTSRRSHDYPELQLGCLAPARPLEDTLDRIEHVVDGGARPLDRVADVLRRNRAVLLAAHNLAGTAHATGAALSRELAPFVAERTRRAAALTRTEELLERTGAVLGIPIWGIKGLSSRAAYPEPALRELRDADVAVATAEETFALAEELRRHGYTTDRDELPWIKEDAVGAPYGQYKLIGPDGYSAVDIHFGRGYSTGHCGLLPMPLPERPGLSPLPLVANLRPMLGNSGGDVHITVKDVNDLWTAAEVLDPASITALARDARTAALHGHLAAIATLTTEITSATGDRLGILDLLATSSTRRPSRPVVATGMMSRTAPVRVLRTTRRAYGQAAAQTRSLPTRIGAVAGAFAFYLVNARPRVLPAPALARTPAPWRCVRLVPLGLADTFDVRGPDAGAEWGGDRLAGPDRAPDHGAAAGHDDPPVPPRHGSLRWSLGRAVLTHNDSVFVSTVWGVLPRGVVRAAVRGARPAARRDPAQASG